MPDALPPWTGEEARLARWTEHFAEVLGGSVVGADELLSCVPLALSPLSTIRCDAPNVESALARLKEGKGVGSDGLAAEVLKAGGSVVAILVSRLLSAIVAKEQWPIQQRGGPIVDVYKKGKVIRKCVTTAGDFCCLVKCSRLSSPS